MKQSNIFSKKHLMLKLFIFVTMTAFISCGNVPKKRAAPVAIPAIFSQSGAGRAPEKWWTALNDPLLNELIKSALAGNLNLQSVWDRLDQSRAIAVKSGAEELPGIDATAGASRSLNIADGGGRTYASRFSLGVAADYELDLWGRLSSVTDAAKADLLASSENLYASAISLSAEVATVWYKLVENRGQLKLLDKQIKNHEDYLEIVTVRFRQGSVPSTDVLQQRQSLESTRESKIKVETAIKILENQLTVLLGKAPGTLTIPKTDELPTLPPLPEAGLPAELIQKRPDIKSAYLSVESADHKLATAIANRFPRISFSANIETSDADISNIFKNWLGTIAGNLLMPLFDAGSRAAESSRAKSARSESLNKYGQVILNSLKEVEDSLIQESQQKKRLDSLEKQFELSIKSVMLTRESYMHGVMDFLRLLNTLLNHHALQRTQLTAQRELIEYRINLYRALGGSFEMNRAESESK